MEATSGFFQKCQQYLNFRGSNSSAGSKISQNYQVGSEDSDIEDNENFDEDSNDQSLSSRFTPFQRSYQKVSTEDKTTKYSDSYQNLGSNDDFYDATSTNNSSSRRKDSEDWGWGGDNEWSDAKSNSNVEQKTSKKSSNSTLGGLAKKKSEKAKTNEDLLIDFGASSNAEKKNQVDDSWANWENDAWESLSKKD